MDKSLHDYFPKWMNDHRTHLTIVRESLADWALISAEKERCENTKRPLAIVFDLDEVLIASLPWNYNALWQYFPPCEPRFCPMYPKSLDVIEECRRRNLKIFFVTARTNEFRKSTIDNLEYHKLIPDLLMTMPQGSDPKLFKTECRKAISQNFRVVASIGDQLSDLGDYTDINYLIPNPFYKSNSSSN